MTGAVYVGPRCPDHPGARCIEARCVECGNRVGNPVTACTDCGYTSCPGRCGLPPLTEISSTGPAGVPHRAAAAGPARDRDGSGASPTPVGNQAGQSSSARPLPTEPPSAWAAGVNRALLGAPPTTVQVSEPPTTGAGGGSLICTTNGRSPSA